MSRARGRAVDRGCSRQRTGDPGPPKGPLLVGEVTPDSCKLTYMSPDDDGGSPITNYVVERLNVGAGYRFVSGLDLASLENSDLSSFSGVLEFKFGSF